LKAFETVAVEIPAAEATSRIVTPFEGAFFLNTI
jgi:hypothetical protein